MNYKINYQTAITDVIKDKKVLWFPLISMRDYDTGEFNLKCDGNINRITSIINNAKADVTLVLPSTNTINNEIVYNNKFIDSVYVTDKGTNAKEIRESDDWETYLSQLAYTFNSYDLIIFEPNIIGSYIHKIETTAEIIFYNVTSRTITNDLYITEYQEQLNTQALENGIPMVVSCQGQVDYYTSKGYDNILIENKVIDNNYVILTKQKAKTIFLPFRQTDTNYKLEQVFHTMENMDLQGINVIYTLPNGVNKISEYNIPNAFEVPTTMYETILSTKPIVINVDDYDSNIHNAIFEQMYYDCDIIYIKNNLFSHKDKVGEINDMSELGQAIYDAINR